MKIYVSLLSMDENLYVWMMMQAKNPRKRKAKRDVIMHGE
jgi:hypothetical protein